MSSAALSAAPPLDAGNPWPGLESFREDDKDFFNGRDDDARELLRLVQRERLTVLYGVSGLGKSSLLQAGLFPELRTMRTTRMLPVYVRLAYTEQAPPPRVQVLDLLAAAGEAAQLEAPALDAGATLWENFHRQGARFWTPDNLPVTPVLVLDQFEEAFTVGRATPRLAASTADFIQELADLVEGRVPAAVRARLDADPRRAAELAFAPHRYKVLLSLREDFLAELETLHPRMPSLGMNRMRLTPLSGEAALQVTAAGGEALVPPEVGELIVRLVAEEEEPDVPLPELAVDPALLSLFCRALNERRRALGLPSVTADLVQGNRASILANFYEEGVRGLGDDVRNFIEKQLLTVNGFRDSEAVENAVAAGVTPEALETLLERRLIRREERGGRARIELAHDVLIPAVRESRGRRELIARQQAAHDQMLAEREAARVRLRRWRRVAGFITLLGLVSVVLGVSAVRNERLARQSAQRALDREREALLQAELTTELLRVDDERAQRDSAAGAAARTIKEAARRAKER